MSYMNKKTCLEREFKFVITLHMILWLCKSFTVNSDIFRWGLGVGGKLPGGNWVQTVNRKSWVPDRMLSFLMTLSDL